MSVIIGFTKGVPVSHRTGTVYGTYTATSADTDIAIGGGSGGGGSGSGVVTLPANPSVNQVIRIKNTGKTNATVLGASVVATLLPGQLATFLFATNTGVGGSGGSWAIVWATCAQVTTLPNPYTYPIRQYAGPSETPYAEFSTNENIFIVLTECGNSIYRVKTLTYTARSEPGQRKVVITGYSNISGDGNFPTLSSGGGTYLGATASICFASANSVALAEAPVEVIGNTWKWKNKQAQIGVPGITYDAHDKITDALIAPSQPIYSGNVSENVSATLYYLDETEDWTYILA